MAIIAIVAKRRWGLGNPNSATAGAYTGLRQKKSAARSAGWPIERRTHWLPPRGAPLSASVVCLPCQAMTSERMTCIISVNDPRPRRTQVPSRSKAAKPTGLLAVVSGVLQLRHRLFAAVCARLLVSTYVRRPIGISDLY